MNTIAFINLFYFKLTKFTESNGEMHLVVYTAGAHNLDATLSHGMFEYYLL